MCFAKSTILLLAGLILLFPLAGCGDTPSDDDDSTISGDDDTVLEQDADADGFDASEDCDDQEPDAYPGNIEKCDGIDNNCSGEIDDIDPRTDSSVTGAVLYYADADADGYGSLDSSLDSCETTPPGGYSTNAYDCDDSNAAVYPFAPEVCDGVPDNDCDGEDDPLELDADGDAQSPCDGDCDDAAPENYTGNSEVCDGLDNNCNDKIDEGLTEVYYFDADSDGFGTITAFTSSCSGPVDGYADNSDDCDDSEASVYPGANHICDGIQDNDCDSQTDPGEDDGDADGQSACNGDCDDADVANFTGNVETCDGADNDCDGEIDNGLPLFSGYRDGDGDGYGDPASALEPTCAQPGGSYVEDNTDCDDGRDTVHPDAEDICDGIWDNNCDGQTDPLESDDDLDSLSECDEDCDDGNSSIYPGNSESCDGIDNDCDGEVDNGVDFYPTYVDSDLDGYGDPNNSAGESCAEAASGESLNAEDCNDGDATVYPGAADQCDEVLDNDCDGETDPMESDADSDGYSSCQQDCDDENSAAYPDAAEVCDSTPDNNCDGVVDEGEADADLDGESICAGDCDDSDGNNFSSNTESCDNADNDCNGQIDDGIKTDWYVDADDDGYGDPLTITPTCDGPPEGYISDGTDCDDEDPSENPGMDEHVGDGIDNNCDGISDTDIYVLKDGDSPEPDKPSYPSIQAAILVSTAGNVIAVGPGTYLESISFMGKDIILVSLEGPSKTTIDADGDGSAATFADDESSAAVLNGFTITGGSGSDGVDCGSSRDYTYGGGICIDNASPSLMNLVIDDNTAEFGGGISMTGSAATLSELSLTSNKALNTGGALYFDDSSGSVSGLTVNDNTASFGGAAGLDASTPDIVDSSFEDNVATDLGGAFYMLDSEASLSFVEILSNSAADYGGGIYASYSPAVLTNVRILDNNAASAGGIQLAYANMVFNNCLFSGNTAVYNGGGLHIDNSAARLTNVVLSGNQAGYAGGGAYLSFSGPNMTNVTISGNTGVAYGGGLYLYFAGPIISNSILAFNQSPTGGNMHNSADIQPSLNYNCFYRASGTPGYVGVLNQTNIVADPAFMNDFTDGDWENDDYHLAGVSAAVNSGNADESYLDPDGSINDMGAYGGPSAGGWDLDGDGYYDWWNPAVGIDPGVDDCEDQDPEVYPGSGCE